MKTFDSCQNDAACVASYLEVESLKFVSNVTNAFDSCQNCEDVQLIVCAAVVSSGRLQNTLCSMVLKFD